MHKFLFRVVYYSIWVYRVGVDEHLAVSSGASGVVAWLRLCLS